MTTIHYTDLPDADGLHKFPRGFWTGLMLFGAIWLVPVLTLIAISCC